MLICFISRNSVLNGLVVYISINVGWLNEWRKKVEGNWCQFYLFVILFLISPHLNTDTFAYLKYLKTRKIMYDCETCWRFRLGFIRYSCSIESQFFFISSGKNTNLKIKFLSTADVIKSNTLKFLQQVLQLYQKSCELF